MRDTVSLVLIIPSKQYKYLIYKDYKYIFLMDDISKKILKETGLHFETDDQLNGMFIERDMLINNDLYETLLDSIMELKKKLSSSTLTALHKEAKENQKWPLLNLVRQILGVYGFKMEPVRKSNGYTSDGKKLFKRFFHILKK